MKTKIWFRWSWLQLIVYTMIIVFASCNNPVMEIEPGEKTIKPGIPALEEKIFMMNPIEQYPAYATDETGKVFGLNGNAREAIVLKDEEGKIHPFKDFFVKDGTVFFSVIILEQGDPIPDSDPVVYESVPAEHFYFQTGGEITEDTESGFPDIPEATFKTMAEGNFHIIEKYGHSEVVRGTSPTAFVMIDGYFYTSDGLWFSVPETISIRKKGVYFYDNVINLSPNPQFVGRVWRL